MATRTKSANETLVDLFNSRAIDLLRVEVGTRNKILRLLNQLEKDIVVAVASIDPTAPARQLYQRQRLEKLLVATRAAIRAAYRKTSVLMTQELRNLIDVEAAWAGRAINAATRATFIDAGLTRTMIETIASDVMIQGAPTKDWWARQAAGLSDRFADEMRRGMLLGEPNAKLIQRIRGAEGVRGLMDISRASAERLVRSSVQTAANAARQATYAENNDLIAAEQWSATLDTRTSHWCIVRDGLDYTPGDHEPIGHDVPWLEGPGALHWNCRSTSIPVLKSWRELGLDMDEIPETTRASMDGQVPAATSYEDWLREQPAGRQDTVLGEEKADLWRRGKIEFRDLLDQSGRPLSAEQLRDRM